MGQNDTKFTITYEAKLNADQLKGSINEIQKSLNKIDLPSSIGKDLSNTFSKLAKELQSFEGKLKLDLSQPKNLESVGKSYQKIIDLSSQYIATAKNIENIDLSKMLPKDTVKQIQDINKAILDYSKNLKDVENKSSLKQTTEDIKKYKDEIEDYEKKISKANDIINKQTAIKNSNQTSRIDKEQQIKELQQLIEYQKRLELLNKYNITDKKTTSGTIFSEITNELNQLKKIDISDIEEKIQNLQKYLTSDKDIRNNNSIFQWIRDLGIDTANKGPLSELKKLAEKFSNLQNLENFIPKNINFSYFENLKNPKDNLNTLKDFLKNLEEINNSAKSYKTKALGTLSNSIKVIIEEYNKTVDSTKQLDVTKGEGIEKSIKQLYSAFFGTGEEQKKAKESLGDLSLFTEKIQDAIQRYNAIKNIKSIGSNAKEIATNLGLNFDQMSDSDIKKAENTLNELSKYLEEKEKLIKKYGPLSTSEEVKNQLSSQISSIYNGPSDLNQMIQDLKEYNNLSNKSKAGPNLQWIKQIDTTKLEKLISMVQKFEDLSNLEKSQPNLNLDDFVASIGQLSAQGNSISELTTKINNLKKSLNGLNTKDNTATSNIEAQNLLLVQYENELKNAKANLAGAQSALDSINATNASTAFQQIKQQLSDIGIILPNEVNSIEKLKEYAETVNTSALEKLKKVVEEVSDKSRNASDDLGNMTGEKDKINDLVEATKDFNSQMDMIKSRIKYFFSLGQAIQFVKRSIREAYNTVKELDTAMTETAVVTDFTVADMWEQLPRYTQTANELGVTTKGVYETMTLFYQQGLDTNEVFEIGTETLKMARIAGLDYATATDYMTAALRGFNMELTETSAQKVNDVYSQLAAITASDTQEISVAMTKVASLASSANMEFETTAAFLAQIVETTRESAETAGTALKTVVARFSEVKELYSEGQLTGTDEEGSSVDVNKISTALRTAGIDLNKYFLGEVGLDDIFMELASKWDSLTQVQQRYIATQAAGSRQQSRFIALMSDYERMQELVAEAYDSEGASSKQFEKTQDSLESKLNKLSNAWSAFTMGLANNEAIKSAVDALTTLLNAINKLTDSFGSGWTSILNAGIIAGGLFGGGKLFNGLIAGATNMYKNPNVSGSFKTGWHNYYNDHTTTDANGKTVNVAGHTTPFQNYRNLTNHQSLIGSFKNLRQGNKDINSGEQAREFLEGNGYFYLSQDEQEFWANNDQNIKNAVTNYSKLGQAQEKVTQSSKTLKVNLAGTAAGIGMIASLAGSLISNMDGISESTKQTASSISTIGTAVTVGASAFGIWGAIIAGAGATIIELYNSYESVEEKALNSAQDFSDKIASAYKTTTSEISDLTTNFGTLTNSYKDLDNLIVGTSEWRDKLEETNETVLKLLETYPNLQQQFKEAVNQDAELYTIGDNGELFISEENQEKLLKFLDEYENKLSYLSSLSSSFVNTRAVEKEYQNNYFTTGELNDSRSSPWQNSWYLEFDSEQLEEVKKLYFKYGSEIFDSLENGLNSSSTKEQKKIIEIFKEAGLYFEDWGLYDNSDLEAYKSYLQQLYEYNSTLAVQNQAEISYRLTSEGLSLNKTSGIVKTLSENLSAGTINFAKKDAEEIRNLFSDNLKINLHDLGYDTNEEIQDNKTALEDIYNQWIAINGSVEQYKEILSSLGNNTELAGQLSSILQGDWDNVEDEIYDKLKNNKGNGYKIFSELFGSETLSNLSIGSEEANNYIDSLINNETESIKILSENFSETFGGDIPDDISNYFSNLTRQERSYLNSAYTSISKFGNESSQVFFELMFTEGELSESTRKLTDVELEFFKTISNTNPIEAYRKLNNELEHGTENAKKLASTMLQSSSINAEAQFGYLWNSEGFQDVLDDLSETFNKNGILKATDIQEAADDYSDFQQVIDNTGISAAGFAKILNLINEEGNDFDFTHVTSEVLAAASAFDSINTTISKALKSIEDFDAGIDEGEAADFLSSGYDTISELIENGDYGNGQIKSYFDYIYGSAKDYSKENIKELENLLKNNQTSLANLWTQAANNSDAFEHLQFGYGENGGLSIAVNAGSEVIVQDLAEGLKISEDLARLMVTDLKNSSLEVENMFDIFDKSAGIEKWKEELGKIGDYTYYTKQQFEDLQKLYGEDISETDLKEEGLYYFEDPSKYIDNFANLFRTRLGDSLKSTFKDSEGNTFEIYDLDKIDKAIDDAGLSQYREEMHQVLLEGKEFAATIDGLNYNIKLENGETVDEAIARTKLEIDSSTISKGITEAFDNIEITIDGDQLKINKKDAVKAGETFVRQATNAAEKELEDATGDATDDLVQEGEKAGEEAGKAAAEGTEKGWTEATAYEDLYGGWFDQLNKQIQNDALFTPFKESLNSIFRDVLQNGEGVNELQEIIDDLDFSDPLQAVEDLSKASEKGIRGAAQAANELTKTWEGFTDAQKIQYIVSQESFEDTLESYEEIIEEQGELSNSDVKKLVKSFKSLQSIVDKDSNKIKALKKLLNSLADKKIDLEISDIDDNLLDALDQISVSDVYSDAYDIAENFDIGKDADTIIDFLEEILETVRSDVDHYDVGSDQLKKVLSLAFGEEWYYQQVDKYGNNVEGLQGVFDNRIASMEEDEETNGFSFFRRMAGWLPNLVSVSGEKEGTIDIKIEDGTTTEEIIKAMSTANGSTYTEDYVKMMLTTWLDKNPWAKKLLGANDFDEYLGKIGQNQYLSDGKTARNLVFSEEQIAAIADAYYQTVDDIKAKIQEFNSENEMKITVRADYKWADEAGNEFSGDQLYESFKEQLQKVYGGDGIQEFLEQTGLLKDGKIQLSDLEIQLGNLGLSDEQKKSIEEKLDEKYEIVVDSSVDTTSIEQTIDSVEQEISSLPSKIDHALDLGAQTGAAKILSALKNAGQNGAVLIANALMAQTYSINITGQVTFSTGTITPNGAAGGIVQSFAAGSANRKINPGEALTGEEGPEIVWNKEAGYAYIAGQNGPEFNNLKPGDRVFTASETQRIFRNSLAKGGLIESYATGKWVLTDEDKDDDSSSDSSSDTADPTYWKNSLDWLYNLMEDIAELEREQVRLQNEYEDYLDDDTKTGKDLFNLLVEQLGNLYTQLNYQTAAYSKRQSELQQLVGSSQYSQYAWWNSEDQTIEIDWDAIEAIQDQDTYEGVEEFISELENAQEKMDEAYDAIQDIEDQIKELQEQWRDTYIDFEQRVYDAIVTNLQTVIDNYSDLNETLTEANTNILNSIQKEIDLERQIRDNTQTEDDITKMESRLAYLRRDTTGANQSEILSLEEELEQKRQEYSDTLIDQALDQISESNELASEQRTKQIELMQSQLDYSNQSGEYWEEVNEMIADATAADGSLLTDSTLVDTLKQAENWEALSQTSQEVWEDELNSTFKEVVAWILQTEAIDPITGEIAGVAANVSEVSSQVGSSAIAVQKAVYDAASSVASAVSSISPTINIDNSNTASYQVTNGLGTVVGTYGSEDEAKQAAVTYTKDTLDTLNGKGYGESQTLTEYIQQMAETDIYKKINAFATGGLNTATGLAWLDGTPSEPEYVLNARQTQAFLKLADVLPSIMSSGSTTNSSLGSTYINLTMNVDEIGSDYDVDRLAAKVKDIMYNSASYRNVNVLNFSR